MFHHHDKWLDSILCENRDVYDQWPESGHIYVLYIWWPVESCLLGNWSKRPGLSALLLYDEAGN